MTNQSTNDPIIIFYRTERHKEESIKNQKAFLEAYAKHLPITTIDYVTKDYRRTIDIFELIKQESNKLIVIMQSALSKDEFNRLYGQHIIFNSYKSINKMDIYYMDSNGKLYKEVDNIEELNF